MSPKECIGAHSQLLGTLVGTVDTDVHNLLGEARSVSPCSPQSLYPCSTGQRAGRPGSIPALSSRWQEHHLDCSVPGAASGQAKDNIVSMHRNTLCSPRFPGNQITGKVNSVVRLWRAHIWGMKNKYEAPGLPSIKVSRAPLLGPL